MVQRIFKALTLLPLILLFASCSNKKSEMEFRAEAQAYEQDENYQEALQSYRAQLETYPKGEFAAETVQKVAYIYYNNFNEFDKAIEYHEKLIKEYPESKYVSQARFMIGYIYANNLKDYERAKLAYQEFLDKHPDDELVDSVNWELEHLGKDINEQLKELFNQPEANGKTTLD